MKISIITVCYNAEKIIEKTIKSVVEQKYHNIEYIIIDGNSKDRTLEIVNQYDKYSNIRIISEPDNGIYDAMNKGARIADGKYIQFLNAGDILIDTDVITRVATEIENSAADIFYGNIIYRYPDGNSNRRVYGQLCSHIWYYLLGDCINHQAIFTKKECFAKCQFNLSYRICADREWMIRLKKQHCRFEAVNFDICEYSLDEESASIKNQDLYFAEASRCIKEQIKWGYWLYRLVDRIRHGKMSAKILHKIYEIVFIRNQ